MHRQGTFIRGTDRAGSRESVEAVDSFALEGRDPRARMPIENHCRGLGQRFPARGSRAERWIWYESHPSKSFRIIDCGERIRDARDRGRSRDVTGFRNLRGRRRSWCGGRRMSWSGTYQKSQSLNRARRLIHYFPPPSLVLHLLTRHVGDAFMRQCSSRGHQSPRASWAPGAGLGPLLPRASPAGELVEQAL